MNDKFTRWTFTDFDRPVFRKPQLFDFHIFQAERCPKTFRLHYQGYLETIKPYTQAQIKRIYGSRSVHLEPAEKSREMNIMYCSKPDSYAGYREMVHGNQDVWIQSEPDFQILSWGQIINILRPNIE